MSHQLRHIALAGATLALFTHCTTQTPRAGGVAPAPAKVEVAGADAASLNPQAPEASVVNDPLTFDAVVVGGGVAGMTSALYLTDAGKRVLVLERGPSLSQLATWSEGQNHIRYQRADRKLADSSAEFLEILKHIGAPARKVKSQMPGDGYWLGSDLYTDLWNPATLAKLPGGFATFERELRAAIAAGRVPVPPFETFGQAGGSMELDTKSARTWIQSMGKTDGAMDDVIDFANIYSRAVLGASSGDVSAMLFAAAIASDLEGAPNGRHRSEDVLEQMAHTLEKRATVFWGKTSASVTAIRSRPEGAEVVYNLDGKSHRVRAKYVVYAQQLKFAPALIEGYERLEPEAADWMRRLSYGSVLEHHLQADQQAYRANLRTWIHSTESDLPVILTDLEGGLTAEDPVGQSDLPAADVQARAQRASERVTELMKRLSPEASGGTFTVNAVTSTRWPLGVHSLPPGSLTQIVNDARKPFERIFFASQDLGAPFFEESLFRGHCAAVNVLMRINRSYKSESWSRCPVEKADPAKPAKSE